MTVVLVITYRSSIVGTSGNRWSLILINGPQCINDASVLRGFAVGLGSPLHWAKFCRKEK